MDDATLFDLVHSIANRLNELTDNVAKLDARMVKEEELSALLMTGMVKLMSEQRLTQELTND